MFKQESYETTYRRTTLATILRDARRQGAGRLLRTTMSIATHVVRVRVLQAWHRAMHGGTFQFRGETHHYFNHLYNLTWRNERAVEVPIIRNWMKRGGAVLEIGHVLGHYGEEPHDVVDKYEKVPGVVQADATDYTPSRRYDLVVSISTLEHIGFDEEVKDPEKVGRAIRNLRDRCLAPGGQLVFTVPVGYNMDLDRRIMERQVPVDELWCLKRSAPYEWVEVPPAQALGMPYDRSMPTALAVLVVVVKAVNHL